MTGRTILLVDDNADNRDLLAIILRHYGCEVLEAVDGLEGVQQARHRRPDLILMDLSMPVLDGLAATALLKRDATTCDIPVVALSAHDDPRVIGDALAAGACGYLVKPARPSRVVQEIERWLGPPAHRAVDGPTDSRRPESEHALPARSRPTDRQLH